jgi:hypothetical protein
VDDATSTGDQTPTFAEPTTSAATSNPLPEQQQPTQLPPSSNFPMSNPYQTWTPLDTTPTTNQIAEFTPDMGDFSAAFQNGDLYLWNDMTADSFGGWVPQSGMYSGMEFGGVNGQGF